MQHQRQQNGQQDKPAPSLELTPIMKKFVLHWGEMGSRWGVNRTVAQIHALLYISPRALNAEEVTETLSVARSNVSTSLRELQNWGIVKVVHVLGDRRDHFESVKGVWEMFQIILDERKRREVNPTLAILEECAAEVERSKTADPHTRERIGELLEFFQTVTSWYEQLRRMPLGKLRRFIRMGGKLMDRVRR